MEGVFAQTWSGETPLRREDDYRVYGPESGRYIPKRGNAGLGNTALVTTWKYLLLGQ